MIRRPPAWMAYWIVVVKSKALARMNRRPTDVSRRRHPSRPDITVASGPGPLRDYEKAARA